MHDPHHALQMFAWVWLSAVAVFVVYMLAKGVFGTAQQRELGRAEIVKTLNNSGWILLSLALKFVGYAFPRLDRHVPWLWIPPLAVAALTWALRAAKWNLKRRARTRPAQSAYTRSLTKTARRNNRKSHTNERQVPQRGQHFGGPRRHYAEDVTATTMES